VETDECVCKHRACSVGGNVKLKFTACKVTAGKVQNS